MNVHPALQALAERIMDVYPCDAVDAAGDAQWWLRHDGVPHALFPKTAGGKGLMFRLSHDGRLFVSTSVGGVFYDAEINELGELGDHTATPMADPGMN